MGIVIIRHPRIFIGADADKSTVVGLPGDTYEGTDSGIKYFHNEELSTWDNGHKQRVRTLGRGFPVLGSVIAMGWNCWRKTLYRGSNLEGVITNIKFWLEVTGPGTVDVRMQDITNAQTIGQSLGLSGGPTFYDIGLINNLPTGDLNDWEFQLQPSGGGVVATIMNIFILNN